MAAITATNMQGLGKKTITRTTLGASDTFAYNSSKNPILILDNITVGALTPTIDGSAAPSALQIAGVGTVDLTAGYLLTSIAAGACAAIRLSDIAQFLVGTVTITGADGMKASLLEF